MTPLVKKYALAGGSKVTVYKVFGKRFYFAVVELEGAYPGDGNIAHNKGRNEFVLVIKGKIEVTKDGITKNITGGGTILLQDGCKYEISGKGKSLVFVDDGVNAKGQSLIEAK